MIRDLNTKKTMKNAFRITKNKYLKSTYEEASKILELAR